MILPASAGKSSGAWLGLFPRQHTTGGKPRLGDRFNPKKVWSVALLAVLAGLTLFAFAPSIGWLYLSVALLGGGGSTSMVRMITLLGNWFGARVFPVLFGTVNAVTAIFGAAAPILAGLCLRLAG